MSVSSRQEITLGQFRNINNILISGEQPDPSDAPEESHILDKALDFVEMTIAGMECADTYVLDVHQDDADLRSELKNLFSALEVLKGASDETDAIDAQEIEWFQGFLTNLTDEQSRYPKCVEGT
jgi:hypothetical protein